jgi:hypothetical protein
MSMARVLGPLVPQRALVRPPAEWTRPSGRRSRYTESRRRATLEGVGRTRSVANFPPNNCLRKHVKGFRVMLGTSNAHLKTR